MLEWERIMEGIFLDLMKRQERGIMKKEPINTAS
jgi:hypothetical protein